MQINYFSVKQGSTTLKPGSKEYCSTCRVRCSPKCKACTDGNEYDMLAEDACVQVVVKRHETCLDAIPRSAIKSG
jgi:hypothetical protein